MRNLIFTLAFAIVPEALGQQYAYWDYNGPTGFRDDGTEAVLTLVQYALAGPDADLNSGDAPFSTHDVDLQTDWQQLLRDAGIGDSIIESLTEHYRADVIEEWVLQAGAEWVAVNPPATLTFWCRVWSDAGAVSGWTKSPDGIPVRVQVVPPAPPVNLRCSNCEVRL